MERTPSIVVGDEIDLYPTHEEDHVPQGGAHARQYTYLVQALDAYRADWRAEGDHCLHWERGNPKRYVAADVVVIAGPRPEPPPKVYLSWRHEPILFVAEIASDTSRGDDTGRKFAIYERELGVPEYLYADPERRELRLWRLIDGRYRSVRPAANGRVWSAQLELWFGYDEDNFLRIYTPEGERFPTLAEARQHAEAEARRAEAEARRAEAEARRAEAEARAREAAERRLARLEAELARLRRPGGPDAP